MAGVPRNKNALEQLKAAANLRPRKKVVVLNNGEEFVFWHKPLTLAQRDRAKENAKDDSITSLAIKLVIEMATDEGGSSLFTPGDESQLRHFVRDSDLQKIMVALMNEREDDDVPEQKVPQDSKSPTGPVRPGQLADPPA